MVVARDAEVALPPQLVPCRPVTVQGGSNPEWRDADFAASASVSLIAGSREVKNVTSFSTRVGVPSCRSKTNTWWM